MSTALINRLLVWSEAGTTEREHTLREAAMELKSLQELKHLLGFWQNHPADLTYDGQHWSINREGDGWQSDATQTARATTYASPLAALRGYKKVTLAQERIADRAMRSALETK